MHQSCIARRIEDGLASRSFRAGFVLAILLAAFAVQADVTIPQEYAKLIQHQGEITAFGSDGFGDRIDIGTGGLEIVQTDVDIPGNNALPVRVSRRFLPGNKRAIGHFGVWNLDIPYAHGVFANHVANPKGWTVDALPANVHKRCSHYAAPLIMTYQLGAGEFEPDEYWHGNFLHIPGAGDEEMLGLNVNAHVPNDGKTYAIVTKSGASIRCVGLAATSEAGSQGEGFEVVAADGTVYTLNQMVTRLEEPIVKPIDDGLLHAARTSQAAGSSPMAAYQFMLPRRQVLLYPTKVADRFGNTVTYTWSATNPWQLLQIVASDGRQVSFSYASGSGYQVTSVTDGTRTWTYTGTSSAYTVTRPDGSQWVSNLTDLFNFQILTGGDSCIGEPTYSGPASVSGTITAPTGAVATFTMKPVKQGRSWVPWECVSNSSGPIYAREPIAYWKLAIDTKKLTGPGLPGAGLSWTHAYGPTNGCWATSSSIPSPLCTGSSPTTRTVTVTEPDGAVTRYTFGNRFYANEGLLLKTESGWNGTSALRSVETTFASPSAAPYTSYYGGTPRMRGDTLITSWMIPPRKTVTVQQGRTFTWEVAADCTGVPYCFDTFARPTRVVRTSNP